MKKIKEAPADLGAAGKKFWQEVMSEYALEEAHDLARLSLAAASLDDIDLGERQIKIDGMYIFDRYGGLKEHPAAKAIRDNRILFCRIIRELALDIETPGESRPPRLY